MAENGKAWFRLRWRTLFLLVVLGAIGWSAYSYWSEYSEQATRKARELMSPTVGTQCTVIFRNEELGLEQAMLTPMVIDGVQNSVRGTFVKINDDWVVLASAQGEQFWVPREHVLLLRIEP